MASGPQRGGNGRNVTPGDASVLPTLLCPIRQHRPLGAPRHGHCSLRVGLSGAISATEMMRSYGNCRSPMPCGRSPRVIIHTDHTAYSRNDVARPHGMCQVTWLGVTKARHRERDSKLACIREGDDVTHGFWFPAWWNRPEWHPRRRIGSSNPVASDTATSAVGGAASR